MKISRNLVLAATVIGTLTASVPAHAVPALQLYIDGATYDSGEETWVLSSSDTVTLWLIGNPDTAGGIDLTGCTSSPATTRPTPAT